MKWISLFILAAMLSAGGKMKITSSTSQEWAGGLQQSGYGTDFKLELKVKAGSDKLVIDEMWVGDIRMPARAVTDLRNPGSTRFSKGDQVFVRAGITYKPDEQGGMRMMAGETKPRPFDYQGAGLLGYTYKGKRQYLIIPSFKELEKIIYP